MPPFNYKLNVLAYDAFAGNTTVLKVGESKPCLLARHSALITQLKELVLPVNEDYEFVPHVTVGHGTYKRPNYDLDGLSFSIKSLFVKHNGNYLIDRRFLGGRV
jgi:2'-5' RNA ligase